MDTEKAIFNWLQIAVVSEARPEDEAAKKTADFFREILVEDHNISDIRYERDPFNYLVFYEQNGENYKLNFATSTVEKLIMDIENEPKFRL